MNDGVFQRARKLFGGALDLPVGEREAWIRAEGGEDAEAIALAIELLAQHEELPEDYLETPPPVMPAGLESLVKDGLLFGDFQLKRALGSGGSGVVYLANQLSLDREVALKVFRPFTEDSERATARFLAEAKSAARLRHPGIAQVFTASSQDGVPYFSMEYVPGHDLATSVTEIAVGEMRSFFGERDTAAYFEVVARIVRDCADALAHAHANGVLHRDIKPENILVDPEGRPKLVDFGLARDEKLGRHSKTGVVEGTPHYMSPEQARAARDEIDERTDVYSLGVVLFELLTLQRPFGEGTLTEVLQRVATQEPPLPQSLNRKVPSELAAVCSKAMHRVAGGRYASAADFRDDLDRYLAGRPTIARPPGVVQHVGRAYRMNRRKFLAGGLVAAGSVAGIGGYRWLTRGDGKARLDIPGQTLSRSRVSGTVTARPIDWVTGEVGERFELGRLPFDRKFVEPGYYRIQVTVDGFMHEFARELVADQEVSIALFDRPTAEMEAKSDMIEFPAGEFFFEGGPPPFTNLKSKLQAFAIDRHEVSNGDYREFMAAVPNAPKPGHWEFIDESHDDLPLAFISYVHAQMYAEWRGKRLPSFLEFSRAGRGLESRDLPWPASSDELPRYRGNTKGAIRITTEDSLEKKAQKYLHSVRRVSENSVLANASHATPEGALHMLGNVSEWTDTVPVTPGQELLPQQNERICAGHYWRASVRNRDLTMYASKFHKGDSFSSGTVGFRCARSIN